MPIPAMNDASRPPAGPRRMRPGILLIGGCLGIAVCVVTLAGCGGGGKKKSTSKVADKDAPATAAPAVEDVGELPAIDPVSAITVDGGRISVSSPTGWSRAPRSKDYLVRYVPAPQKAHPFVQLVVSDPPAGISEVTEANHAAFVQAIADGLAAEFTKDGKSKLIKKPRAVTLGPHRAVAWTAPGREMIDKLMQSVERWSAAVVIGGRMYTIETMGLKGKVGPATRNSALAVAAALAVPAAAEPAATDAPAPADAQAPADPAAPAAAKAPQDEPAPKADPAAAPADKPAAEEPADTK